MYEELQKIQPTRAMEARYCTGISVAEAFARTLYCDALEDNYLPRAQSGTDLHGAIPVVEKMMCGTAYDEAGFKLGSAGREFLVQVRKRIRNKQFITCTDGFVGIAPPDTRIGDTICVLLGCDAPMLLRPLPSGQYRVVGECFVEGLTMGEALLGPLPKHIRVANILEEAFGDWVGGYLNHNTGEMSYEDPRLKELPVDLSKFRADLQQWPEAILEVNPDIFRQRGVDIKYIDLV